jgi:DNA-binding XRE family transcriptional regulator
MGVQDFTLIKWEQDAAEPYVTYYPAIIEFLGYEPWPEPKTLGERIRAARHRNGLTFREAASHYDIDDGTLLKCEHGRVHPTAETLEKLEALFGGPPRTSRNFTRPFLDRRRNKK